MSEIIYGIHSVQTLIKCAPERFKEVFIAKNCENKRLFPIIHELEARSVVIRIVSRQFLNEKSKTLTHQGIVAFVTTGKKYKENDLLNLIAKFNNLFLLILDGITDPRNLGACIRCADAAGVHAVIVSKNRAAKLNATVKKVSCGSAESVPLIRVTNLVRTIRMLQEKNIWIVGTDVTSIRTIYQTNRSKMSGSIALIMGAEQKGMHRIIRENCDEIVSIPMMGYSSSLNVSVATGICLFEVVRHRCLY